MRVQVAVVLVLIGCGGAERATPSTTPTVVAEVAQTTAPSPVGFTHPEAPAALQQLGVVQHDSDGQHACGVTPAGRVFCVQPSGSTFEISGFPPAIAVEVGNGCGEPLCILTADHVAMCVTTRHGHWDPRERIEMNDVQDVSLDGCFGCAVSLNGHLACFGARTDHIAFLQPPRLVANMENVTDVEVERTRICAVIGGERIVCTAE